MGHRYGMSVKSVAAGEDQRRRVIRHRMGMRGRVKRGLHPSRWPLGYEAIRDESGEVIGAEFTDLIGAISLMTRLFLAGYSYDRIAQALDASAWDLPPGRRWHEVLVRRALQSDVYAGYVNWGEARNPEPSGHFPALWDQATHAAILREREARKGSYRHPRSGPLSGVVFCHRCGSQMGRTMMTHRPGYYLRCSRHSHRNRHPGNNGCHPNHIPETEVMDALAEWLAAFTTPEAIEQALARQSGDDLEGEIERLERRLDELAPKRQRLALAYADGKMDLDIYHQADGELRDAEDSARVRLAELRTMIAARPDPEMRRRYVEEVLAGGLDLTTVPPDELGSALHQAGVQVYVEDRRVLFCAFRM